MRLNDFLLARAEESDDEEQRELLFDLVSERHEMDSAVVERMALLEASRFSDHPDCNSAWAD